MDTEEKSKEKVVEREKKKRIHPEGSPLSLPKKVSWWPLEKALA